MGWNDVVSNLRDKIRQGLHRGADQQIQVDTRNTRLEHLDNTPLVSPALDVFENDREYLVLADVPGGTREGATIAWDEARGLTFVVKSQPLPAGTPWACEYKPCDWYRRLDLPDHVDGSKASSTIKDGVLTIRIPKLPNASKWIPVNAG